MTFGRHLLDRWHLDPAVTYLNHGTVGAVPKVVLAAQQALRDEIEREPARVMLREVTDGVGVPHGRPTRMRVAAEAVARFLGARRDDLVFVDNASAGINAVLRSLPLAPGDELLITDHAYGAVARTAQFVARERGATVVTAALPFPAFRPEAAVEAIATRLSPRTRVVIIDHVAAESSLIIPVAAIARRCHAAGVPLLVDGAHAPGAIALDIPALGVDWYVANLHKWAHAPRSCGILWARPDRQAGLHPLVISWGLDLGFTAEFDWVGTRDPTPWLAAPAGIDFLESLDFAAMRRYTHDLVWDGGQDLTARWGTSLEIEETAVGSMITLPLPASFGSQPADAGVLRDALLFQDRIEVQVQAIQGRLWVRVCGQVYNDARDLERLGAAVAARA